MQGSEVLGADSHPELAKVSSIMLAQCIIASQSTFLHYYQRGGQQTVESYFRGFIVERCEATKMGAGVD